MCAWVASSIGFYSEQRVNSEAGDQGQWLNNLEGEHNYARKRVVENS